MIKYDFFPFNPITNKTTTYGNLPLVGFHIRQKYINIIEEHFLQFYNGSPRYYNLYSTYNPFLPLNNKNIIIHSKFIGNIAKSDTFHKVLNTLETELKLLEKYAITNSGVLCHLSTSHHKTKLESLLFVTNTLSIFADKLNQILNPKFYNYIVLETSKNPLHLGSRIEDFEIIWENLSPVGKTRIRFCINISNILSAGYDIVSFEGIFNYFLSFHKKIGIDKIQFYQLNDSSSILYSNISNNNPIGSGNIFPYLNFIFDNKNNLMKIKNLKTYFTNNITTIQFIKLMSNYFNKPIILNRGSFEINSKLHQNVLIERFIYNIIPYNNINFINIYNKFIIKILISKFKELIMLFKTLGEETRVDIYNKALDIIIKKGFKIIKIDSIEIDNEIIPIMNYDNIKKELSHEISNTIINKIIEIIKTRNLAQLNSLKISKKYINIINLTNTKVISNNKANQLINNNLNTIDNILENITISKNILNDPELLFLKYFHKKSQLTNDEAKKINNTLIKNIKQIDFYLLGSYVRKSEFINNLNILVIGNYKEFIITFKILYREEVGINKNNEYFGMYNINNNYIFIHIINSNHDIKSTNILYYTGPIYFYNRMCKISTLNNYNLTKDGIYDLKNNVKLEIATEAEIFKLLNITYISPEHRELISG